MMINLANEDRSMRLALTITAAIILLLIGSGSLQVLSLSTQEGMQARQDLLQVSYPRISQQQAIFLDENMALIPAGQFIMGSAHGDLDEQPAHRVYLDAYQIDRFEVTNLQYQRFVADTATRPPRYWSDGNFPIDSALLPVVGVSWRQAADYCAWVGKRLPTEAEWERACRGSKALSYPWGSLWDPWSAHTNWHAAGLWVTDPDDAWLQLADNCQSGLCPELIGSYPQGCSSEGVFDLVGNASEWIQDWYAPDSYSYLENDNPVNKEPHWEHVVRGSAWFGSGNKPQEFARQSRCSARNASHSFDDPRIGFRCARSVRD
jgi:formylglycine-generating enzyme required for sulfatase activity